MREKDINKIINLAASTQGERTSKAKHDFSVLQAVSAGAPQEAIASIEKIRTLEKTKYLLQLIRILIQ